jgi:hypothetical protein
MSIDLSNNVPEEPVNNLTTPVEEEMDFFHASASGTTMDSLNFIMNSLTNETTSNIYTRFLEDMMQLPAINDSHEDWRRLLQETLTSDTNTHKLVLSESGEQNVETIEYDPIKYPNIDCCPITIQNFKKGDKISKLPCNHLFNTEAVLKWLKEEKAECPICRFKLESIEKKIEMIPNNTFRPPRLPRRGRADHFRRLMASRLQREEDEDLQTALLASLRDINQY